MTARQSALRMGLRLAEIARERGMTQAQVAKATAAGLKQGTVSRVFAGKSPANSETLFQIADAVGALIKIIG